MSNIVYTDTSTTVVILNYRSTKYVAKRECFSIKYDKYKFNEIFGMVLAEKFKDDKYTISYDIKKNKYQVLCEDGDEFVDIEIINPKEISVKNTRGLN